MREPVYFGVKHRHFAAEGARENEWMGKRVLIVGMARSGIAAAQLLHRAGAVVTVNDSKAEETFGDKLDVLRELGLQFRLGENGLDALENQDVLVISPGVPIDAPIVKKAEMLRIQVLGEMEMAAGFLPCDMVAVTGTNGKTTTVSLLGAIFKEAGKDGYVGAKNATVSFTGRTAKSLTESRSPSSSSSSVQRPRPPSRWRAAQRVQLYTAAPVTPHGSNSTSPVARKRVFPSLTTDAATFCT